MLLGHQRYGPVLWSCLCRAEGVLLASASLEVLTYMQRRSPGEVIAVLSVGCLLGRRDHFIFDLIFQLANAAYLSCWLVPDLSVAALSELLLEINTAVILGHEDRTGVDRLLDAHVHLVPVFADSALVRCLDATDLPVRVVGVGVDSPGQAIVLLVGSD